MLAVGALAQPQMLIVCSYSPDSNCCRCASVPALCRRSGVDWSPLASPTLSLLSSRQALNSLMMALSLLGAYTLMAATVVVVVVVVA